MSKSALILIDMQKGFSNEAHWGGNRNNPQAEKNAFSLLEQARDSAIDIFHVQHCSLEENSPLRIGVEGNEFLENFLPNDGECLIQKNVNSAFIGTDLKAALDDQGIKTLFIAGLTTNHCVSTTTRMAGNYGFEVFVAHDACATFDRKGINGEHFDSETIHATALSSLNDEFATVVSTEDLLEIMKSYANESVL
ncbi:cysteine hydrolase family protein [Aureibacter tunicatorum]|uniref:Nicotinamidase-related amidase n=1 Tax=Aureibacter tunicatorum TaxID=866807 RepID=A0AAE3XQK1_9BACT|nr:cysteine hydrolase family protein [Aureibacter tunicatorum]MDR6240772.1 nicotinamidase-related amidase [Aureibacter tunicatorum]BDD06895.1 isochorismatase [Aureibacter tunicatorum]